MREGKTGSRDSLSRASASVQKVLILNNPLWRLEGRPHSRDWEVSRANVRTVGRFSETERTKDQRSNSENNLIITCLLIEQSQVKHVEIPRQARLCPIASECKLS
jgi:hypothetical protein